ncbi:hypothetical protein DXG01_012685 [Tephrocybe rancida]|nr:hypothetical protein DXG01_012685 [Tephrocybe rancida]
MALLDLGTQCSLIFMIFRTSWAYLFNDDSDVVKLVASIMPIVASFQIFDGNAAVTGGVLRARGMQGIGALLNLRCAVGNVAGIQLGIWVVWSMDWTDGVARVYLRHWDSTLREGGLELRGVESGAAVKGTAD